LKPERKTPIKQTNLFKNVPDGVENASDQHSYEVDGLGDGHDRLEGLELGGQHAACNT
jgi:hypothetical protein